MFFLIQFLQLNADLQVRAALRTVEVGACGLPCSLADQGSTIALAGCVDSETVHSNVEAGLEHPLVGAIVRRRDKVASRLECLKKRQVVECENAALQLRATSNSEVIGCKWSSLFYHVSLQAFLSLSTPNCVVD